MCFEIVRPLARNAQGHFNRWLHLCDQHPGV
jgi:hypothetical protein